MQIINDILDKATLALTQATIRKLEKRQAELDKRIKDKEARVQEFSDSYEVPLRIS